MTTLIRAIRVNHWLKNLLVFIPIIASHQSGIMASWNSGFIAFIAISLAASSGYLFNDLLDLKSDKRHAVKKSRPLAKGELSKTVALTAGFVFFLCSVLVLFVFQKQNVLTLLIYLALSLIYSAALKKIIFVDVLTLIAFYILRIILGANAIGVHVSLWLYIFAFAFFSSLALLKRHSELSVAYQDTRQAYTTDDRKWLEISGISICFTIPIIMGLYIQLSPEAKLYHRPLALLAASPVIVYWMISGWRRSLKDELKEDLILYAFKEKASYICFGIIAVAVGIALW